MAVVAVAVAAAAAAAAVAAAVGERSCLVPHLAAVVAVAVCVKREDR